MNSHGVHATCSSGWIEESEQKAMESSMFAQYCKDRGMDKDGRTIKKQK